MGDFALGGHEINLSDAYMRINTDRVDHFDFQSPGGKLANGISLFVGKVAPAYVPESCGDMGVDAEPADGTAPFEHGYIAMAGCGFVAAAKIKHAGLEDQALRG